jgi:hypothetical protein
MAGPGLLAYIATSKFSDYVGFPVMLCRSGACAWILPFANLNST